MFHRKVLAVAMSGLLLLCLSPAAALAEQLETSAPASQTLPVQAAKTQTVYVLTSVTMKLPNVKHKTTCSYYGNGLLKIRKYPNTKRVWSYDSKSRLKKVSAGSGYASTFKTTSKGVLTSETNIYAYPSGSKLKQDVVYKSSSGKIRSLSAKYKYYADYSKSWSDSGSYARKFTYSKGRVSSEILTGTKQKHTFTYDANGNLKVFKTNYSSNKLLFTNSYDSKGLLKKRQSSKDSSVGGATYTYSYRPIKVSTTLAKTVKAQQWALLNQNLNFALGGAGLPGYLDETALGAG